MARYDNKAALSQDSITTRQHFHKTTIPQDNITTYKARFASDQLDKVRVR